jgi:AraC-like DNA-binding protein
MVDGSSPSTVMTFEYSGPHTGLAYERWIEDLCRRLFQIDMVPHGESLDCRVRAAALPDVTLATITTTPTRVQGSKAAGERDAIVFAFAPTTRCVFDGKSGPIEINQQQGWLTERRANGFQVFGSGGVHTLHISRVALLSKVPFAEDLLNQRQTGNPAVMTLIANYFEALLDCLGRGLDPQGQRLAAEHLVDLVGLFVTPSRLVPEAESRSGVRAARIATILKEIASRAAAADLSAEQVGNCMGVSDRYVRQLLQDTGKTFSEHVLEQRLQLALKLLKDPRLAERKIADIALTAGFNDISHFNRAFRRRFGDIPSGMRASAKVD